MAKCIPSDLNWDSLDEVTALFNKVKSRYFQLKREKDRQPSRKERNRRKFSACRDIWETDISSIYAQLDLDKEPNYYVYAHLDTSKTITVNHDPLSTFAATLGFTYLPFYIGKGKGNRAYELDRNETHRKVCQKLRQIGKQPAVLIISKGLKEQQALEFESKLIDIFGILPMGGSLCNLDEGLSPIERRNKYADAFLQLRNINKFTHVNTLVESGKTPVAPAGSTDVPDAWGQN